MLTLLLIDIGKVTGHHMSIKPKILVKIGNH